MDQLIPSLSILLDPLAVAFRKEVFEMFQLMVGAWIVCLGHRTISRVWETTGQSEVRNHAAAFRLFRAAAWNWDEVCRILILAKQLGPINYFSDEKTRELLALKQKLGYTDPRLDNPSCNICAEGVLTAADPNFVLEPQVFVREPEPKSSAALPQGDFDKLVQAITDKVMAQMKLSA